MKTKYVMYSIVNLMAQRHSPVVRTERGLTAAANFNSCDLPQPGSPTYTGRTHSIKKQYRSDNVVLQISTD